MGQTVWRIPISRPKGDALKGLYNMQTDKCSVMMYADDHQAYTLGERIEDVESILNHEGKEISNWYKDNLLMCNHEKFQSRVEA